MPELDNSKPPLFVPSKRSYNDFVLAWRGHSRKRNYSQLLEWAENPDNAPEALTQQQQTWNSRFFSDLVDSLYNGETDDVATALAAMDAAADDGMRLWTALKREIDITLPSARSHAEDQLKTKTKQKHDETVAEFGLRFRGAVREFKNRGGEMTNYKYAELFAANVHERHRASPLNWLLIWTLTTTTRSSYPTSSVAPTNARPYTIVSYAQIQKTADAALHYPCKGAAVALHTLTTLRCVMRLAARVTTQHVGAATPTQAAEVAVDEADIKVAEADEEDDTRCTTDASHHGIGGTQQYLPPPPPLPSQLMQNNIARPQHYTPQQHQNFQQLGGAYTTYPAYPVLATDASHHGIGGTQQYLPPPPPLPSQLMQNNIARVGEAFPTMNAPPPTGQMYQTGPYRRTFAITLATNEPNCSKYIVDNASPYTLTGSLNHLYDVQQLEKPKEIGGIKKDSTIKCTHVGKIDFTTHEGTLTVSNAYYGFYFGQIDVETAYLYALNEQTKDIFAGHLRKKYRITEPAQLTWALGMKVSFAADGIILTQDLYVTHRIRDASWGDNHENRRSTSGYIFFLNGGPISWASYLQTTVALSTVESEVMALTEAIKEAIYIRRLLESLGAAQEGPTIIYTDSTGAEALVDHPTSHRRTKHIEIRREFIKFHIGHETVKIERVSTKDQLADIMTKPLRQDIHNYLVQMILHG
ncbi:RNA-dependent DNA polymerase [Pseudoscourfieldia marina]